MKYTKEELEKMREECKKYLGCPIHPLCKYDKACDDIMEILKKPFVVICPCDLTDSDISAIVEKGEGR